MCVSVFFGQIYIYIYIYMRVCVCECVCLCVCECICVIYIYIYLWWNDKIGVLEKTTQQVYFKTFIEKVNSGNLIIW